MTRLQGHRIPEILSVHAHTGIDGLVHLLKATNMLPMELGLGSFPRAVFSRQSPARGAVWHCVLSSFP